MLLVVAGCGGSAAQTEPVAAVIEVPPARTATVDSEERRAAPLPRRAEPEPPAAPDPYDDFVGSWDGLVNQTVSTELEVDRSSRFRVRAAPTAFRGACELEGRFRADSHKIWMDVEKTSCSVIAVGSTLERNIVSRAQDVFTVESPDGTLLIRYTRRKP
jgi:hypothetical protein